jgi:type IV secretory pathway TrbF-like protein
MGETDRRNFIRASGMGEYVFCARAWWLRRNGQQPTRGAEARAAGNAWHVRHGRGVRRARLLRRVSVACLYLALALAAFMLLLWWRE